MLALLWTYGYHYGWNTFALLLQNVVLSKQLSLSLSVLHNNYMGTR